MKTRTNVTNVRADQLQAREAGVASVTKVVRQCNRTTVTHTHLVETQRGQGRVVCQVVCTERAQGEKSRKRNIEGLGTACQ